MHQDTHEAEVTIEFDATNEGLGRAANQVRGTILTSFSHVEFMCTDLIVRCLNHPSYAAILKGKIPFRLEKKLTLAKRLFSFDGPLKQYEAEAISLFPKLMTFEKTRHFMAHGMMLVDAADVDALKIHFRIYEHYKGGQIALSTMDVTPDDFAEECRDIQLYAKEMVSFFYKVLTETRLPAAPLFDGSNG